MNHVELVSQIEQAVVETGNVTLSELRGAIGEQASNIQGGIGDVNSLQNIRGSLETRDDVKANNISQYFEVANHLSKHKEEIELDGINYIYINSEIAPVKVFEIVEQRGNTYILKAYLEVDGNYQKRFFVLTLGSNNGHDTVAQQDGINGPENESGNSLGSLEINSIEGSDHGYQVIHESRPVPEEYYNFLSMSSGNQKILRINSGGKIFIGETGEIFYFDLGSNANFTTHNHGSVSIFIGKKRDELILFNNKTNKNKTIKDYLIQWSCTHYMSGSEFNYHFIDEGPGFIILMGQHIAPFGIIRCDTFEFIKSDELPKIEDEGLKYLPIDWRESKRWGKSLRNPKQSDFKYLT